MRAPLLSACIQQLYERCILDYCALCSFEGHVLAVDRASWVSTEGQEHLALLVPELYRAVSSVFPQLGRGQFIEVVLCLSDIPDLPDVRFYAFLHPVGENAMLLAVVGSDVLERQGRLIEADITYAAHYLDQLLRGTLTEILQWPNTPPQS